MARGHQRALSQQKNAEKKAKAAKAGGPSQKDQAQKLLKFKCAVCLTLIPDAKSYKDHFESKHPKAPLPDELKDV